MITVTSVEAQSRFGKLIDRAQRGPTVAYVVSEHDMQALADVKKRREEAARWYSQYRAKVMPQWGATDLTDAG